MSGIEIRGLQVEMHIGVPDEERARAQRLLLDVVLTPVRDFATMPDEMAATVDYFAVCERIKAVAAERPRKLIETLACEVAEAVLREFAVTRVEVAVRKFILPDTEFVAVRFALERNR